MFDVALEAASPIGRIKPLPSKRIKGRTIVLGAGKAAASMAAAFEVAWGKPVEGVVVTRYDHGWPTRYIDVVEAAHPVPDAAGLVAARRIHRLASEATADDLVVFLGSGGMSALLVMPSEGITLEEKGKVTQDLLKSGAAISEINSVRRAMSAIKGGRLAAACEPAKLVSYLISDVPGDDPAVIGSGPTVTPSALADPFEVLEHRQIDITEDVRNAMRANKTPLLKKRPEAHVVIRPKDVMSAAALEATKYGVRPILLGDDIEGEARDVAKSMAVMVRKLAASVSEPTVLLSGGETTVTVRGKGSGGRNMEFLLALGLEVEGVEGVHAIACDTDGIDGMTSHAGAVLRPGAIQELRTAGIDPTDSLEQNDTEAAFMHDNSLVTIGPTRTNVNDFRGILVNTKDIDSDISN